MKSMLVVLFDWLGMGDEELEARLYGHRKEEVIPALGKSARELLISLGTRWGREMVDPQLWVKATMGSVEPLLASGVDVVIDDMRTPNERAAVKAAGGLCVGIVRPGTEVPASAALLEGLLDIRHMDWTIENDGPVTDLHAAIRLALGL